jgi:N-acetylmuramic acid 6-phosphate etherase
MSTEQTDPRYTDLDAWTTLRAVEAMWQGQVDATAAVEAALPAIAAAADAAAARLGINGRLIYCGAGTSGRIAVQDGAELLPTFGWPSNRVGFVLAGGQGALVAAVEDAEDNAADGARQIIDSGTGPEDVVIGVSASGATPFTVACVEEGRKHGALTIGIASNPGAALLEAADHPVLIKTGSEVLSGSTRMKAGTAQKIVLNLISTAVMICLGRVYKGQMVDMIATNAKLRIRAAVMVANIAGITVEEAERALQAAGGIKAAILVASGLSLEEANSRLAAAGGNLRAALAGGV